MRTYYGNFESLQDVINGYSISSSELKDAVMIYADYDTPPYEGYSFVLFVKGGKLYEVNGSHCSCSGLEDSWDPEETLMDAILMRPGVCDDAKLNLRIYYKGLMPFV